MIKIKSLLAGLLTGAFFIGAASAQTGQLGAGQVWGNPNAAQGVAVPSSVSAILDRALGSTRGAILERGASGWAIVGPGATAGLAWVSAGTGADPAYGILGLSGGGCNAALTASNGGILYSTASACSILAGTATARLPLLSGASTTPVWGAYTLPASVTSGGVPYFSSTSAQGSSALLVANQIMLGGGAGLPPATLGSLGSATTVLHGGAGAPTFGAVSLTADVSGQLPIANGGCNGTTAATCLNNITPTPTRAGDLMYWNGSAWVTLAGNNSGTQFLQETSSGVPSWAVVSGTGTVTTLTSGQGISFSSGATCTTSCTIKSTATFAVQYFSASGTFTTPANGTTSTVYHIRMTGGGGGGGGGNTGAVVGNGGGAGGYNEFWCTGVAGSTGIVITIGTGGTAGASAGGSGTAGGNSSYTCNGTIVTAVGGGFLATGVGAGGAGGGASNGTLNITGQNGSPGNTAVSASYGFGGSNPLGPGGVTNTSTGVGQAGNVCGGGGAPGYGNVAGGAGANGCAIVDYVL